MGDYSAAGINSLIIDDNGQLKVCLLTAVTVTEHINLKNACGLYLFYGCNLTYCRFVSRAVYCCEWIVDKGNN